MTNYEFDFTFYIINIIKNIDIELDILNNYNDDWLINSAKYRDSKINELKEAKKVYLKLLNKKYNMIYENSRFNLDEIGILLANLISNIEKDKYIYMKIIDDNGNFNWVIKNNNENKIIILYKNKLEVFNKEIYFYDNSFNKTIDIKDLNYIYEFINQLINYKITYKKDMSKEELIKLIYDFTFEKQTNSYCKKLK